MGFIHSILCQLLFIHGTLQCYQARLEFSDQAFGDNDNAYHEVNDVSEIKSPDFFRSPLLDGGKDTNNMEYSKAAGTVDVDDEDVSQFREDSGDKRRGGQYQHNAKKRRLSKHDRNRAKQKHRSSYHKKGSDIMDNSPDSEISDRDRHLAHYYLTNPTDIANMSAMLGPGPVSIDLTEAPSTTQLPATSNVLSNITNLILDEIMNAANISSDGNDYVSYLGEQKRGKKRKLKSHNSSRKGKVATLTLDDDARPEKRSRKDSKKFQKHNLVLQQDEQENKKLRGGHKKRKEMKIRNEELNTRKDIDKYRLNEEDEYANLSIINKSFQSANRKKFDLKNKHPEENDVFLDGDELNGLELEVDDKSNGEKAKLSLNSEREIIEDQASLIDEDSESEKRNGIKKSRGRPLKGIMSKIEHGDWIYQVTLLPLPDYSVRKNRTHKNKKLTDLNDQDETPRKFNTKEETPSNTKKHIEKKSALLTKEVEDAFDKPSDPHSVTETDKKQSERTSGVGVGNVEGSENKRDERDTQSRDKRRNLRKSRKHKNIFNDDTGTDDENRDELYDTDTKQVVESRSSLKDDVDLTYNNQENSESSKDYYDYDSNLNGDENTVTDVCVANKTTSEKPSSCAVTTDAALTPKPSRKANKSKTFPKSESDTISILSGKGNKTTDPYEAFLCGQLADSFVDEVLKKVKASRKMSRELGYSNETEETCDRCIELKPIKVPELAVVRNALGKCPKSIDRSQNCSVCCGVAKPMIKFLDVLVSYEKDNENSFYSKIQDDSTFIFTGDYPESMPKGENSVKFKDKYADESSIDKDTFDRQRLRDDPNEEKGGDKAISSDSIDKPKDKVSNEKDSASESMETSKEKEGEIKRYQRRFSKNKLDSNMERDNPDMEDSVGDEDFSAGNSHLLHPIDKEHPSNKESDTSSIRRRFGKVWKDESGQRRTQPKHQLKNPQEPGKSYSRSFDRFFVKNSYDYFKHDPSKNPAKHGYDYKYNYEDSPKNALPRENLLDRYGSYKVQNPGRMKDKSDAFNLKNNYYGYSQKNYNHDKTMNLNEKYKSFLYDDNGEYSLYPNLDGKFIDEDVVRTAGIYKPAGMETARMVKRDAENLPAYDDEPNVFFELPDIEYELYK